MIVNAVGTRPASYVRNIKSANAIPTSNYKESKSVAFTGSMPNGIVGALSSLPFVGALLASSCAQPTGDPGVLNPTSAPPSPTGIIGTAIPTPKPTAVNVLETNVNKLLQAFNINPPRGLASSLSEFGYTDSSGYTWTLTRTELIPGATQWPVNIKREESVYQPYYTTGIVTATEDGIALVRADHEGVTYELVTNKTHNDMVDVNKINSNGKSCIAGVTREGSRLILHDPVNYSNEMAAFNDFWVKFGENVANTVVKEGEKATTKIVELFAPENMPHCVDLGKGLVGKLAKAV